MEIYDFRRAPVVGVPISRVANTLVPWLRWMAGSYVGHLDTKMIFRGRRALIPRSCNTSVCLRLCQPSWEPWLRDLPRSVCSCSLASPLWTTKIFMSGMKASLWGAGLMALPSTFGCLGASDLRPP
jgi:hypothetical protein